jgi:hypothetical protein
MMGCIVVLFLACVSMFGFRFMLDTLYYEPLYYAALGLLVSSVHLVSDKRGNISKCITFGRLGMRNCVINNFINF